MRDQGQPRARPVLKESKMGKKSIFFFVALFLTIVATPLSAQLKKVRFSTTGISVSELPFKIAQLKGFYREEGPRRRNDPYSWRSGDAGAPRWFS
jgi:ABC-type nitrate/sulfonate/bicarbonate transport system substrate-binding protein